MSVLGLLIGVSILLGAAGLGAFFWALRTGQFEDLDGGAHRILEEDDPDPERSAGPER